MNYSWSNHLTEQRQPRVDFVPHECEFFFLIELFSLTAMDAGSCHLWRAFVCCVRLGYWGSQDCCRVLLLPAWLCTWSLRSDTPQRFISLSPNPQSQLTIIGAHIFKRLSQSLKVRPRTCCNCFDSSHMQQKSGVHLASATFMPTEWKRNVIMVLCIFMVCFKNTPSSN